MTATGTPRNRPSLREALSAATVALAVGALLAWTAVPAAAARPAAATGSATGDLFRAATTNGLAWIVSPRAARPGEVVHVRLTFKPTFDDTGKPITPVAVFAFRNDLRHLVAGRLYPAESTFGADLLVPPGTDWGQDPIVWGTAQVSLALLSIDRLAVITGQNPIIPFIASRSAQPPLWNR